jgi:hypothetical protein
MPLAADDAAAAVGTGPEIGNTVAQGTWDLHALLLNSEGSVDWENVMGLFQGIVDYLAPLL